MKVIAILGREKAISIAELESFFGASRLELLGASAVLVETDDWEQNLFGGTVKAARLLKRTRANLSPEVLRPTLEQLIDESEAQKVPFGISVYGFGKNSPNITRLALELKKTSASSGKSLRAVTSKQPALNAAQVLRNQLATKGVELIVVKNGDELCIGRTISVQDIDAYSARDHARPRRDPRVGMLPPKLAQIIINLATGPGISSSKLENGKEFKAQITNSQLPVTTILDPFCGTGVILQEAVLMGYRAVGTDIDQKMIGYTKENVIEWLPRKYPDTFGKTGFERGDATNMTWGEHPNYSFDTIASEAYLGRPFSATPPPQVLSGVVQDVDTIIKKFLTNVARQTKPGFRMCIAVPAWRTGSGFRHLPLLDHLEKLGYTRVEFEHVKSGELVYARNDQIVGRELLVLKRK